jgi:hypothetical protein
MFYGWRMVGLVSAIRILGGGLHNYGFTVFFLPLSQDLGLTAPRLHWRFLWRAPKARSKVRSSATSSTASVRAR